VAAAWLLAETDWRIALLEAGDAPPAASRRPVRYLELFRSPADWQARTEPQPGLAGRSLAWPRGRMLGGCGGLNALIYAEPVARDDWLWSQASGSSWPPGALELACRRLREWQPIGGAQLSIDPAPALWPTVDRLLDACRRTLPLGRWNAYPRLMDRGRRQTAFDAFVRPFLRSDAALAERFTLLRKTQVERIEFSGDRACGVQLRDRSRINSRIGVLLAAGALGSPWLLMRSGLGPRQNLHSAGLTVRHDRAEVGANLRDHLAIPVIAAVDDELRFPHAFTAEHRALWRRDGTGPLTSNLAEAGGWFGEPMTEAAETQAAAQADPDRPSPLIQFHLTPTHYLRYPSADAPPAISIVVTGSRPTSHGWLCLRPASARDNAQPLGLQIDPRYLSTAEDRATLRNGVGTARQCLDAFAETRPMEELFPGTRRQDPEQLDRYIERYAQTLYHPVGTCRLGADPQSVVDPMGMVRGADRLAIVDASVFPILPAANPQAITMAVALAMMPMIARAMVNP
jgi:choline dehydrogenase